MRRLVGEQVDDDRAAVGGDGGLVGRARVHRHRRLGGERLRAARGAGRRRAGEACGAGRTDCARRPPSCSVRSRPPCRRRRRGWQHPRPGVRRPAPTRPRRSRWPGCRRRAARAASRCSTRSWRARASARARLLLAVTDVPPHPARLTDLCPRRRDRPRPYGPVSLGSPGRDAAHPIRRRGHDRVDGSAGTLGTAAQRKDSRARRRIPSRGVRDQLLRPRARRGGAVRGRRPRHRRGRPARRGARRAPAQAGRGAAHPRARRPRLLGDAGVRHPRRGRLPARRRPLPAGRPARRCSTRRC